jgi:hypothetical protein
VRLILFSVPLWLALSSGGGDGHGAALRRAEAAQDSAFAGVQARGEVAMGVNQYTSRHIFEPLPDGGRIELQRDVDDSIGTARIQQHMQEIAVRFAAGDFRLPGFVHAHAVPGTALMAARRAAISYSVESLPRGAAVRVRSTDPAAVQAIHAFLAFQRHDHRAGAKHDS